jgi:hypothetical protein
MEDPCGLLEMIDDKAQVGASSKSETLRQGSFPVAALAVFSHYIGCNCASALLH